MSRDGKVDQLRRVGLFAGCSGRELQRIAAITDQVNARRGDVLMKEGRPGSECFIIASGKAVVSADGRAIADLGPGAIVGEMALLDNAPRSATVTADTPMELYVLHGRDFLSLLIDVPSVNRKVLTTLARRLREAMPHGQLSAVS